MDARPARGEHILWTESVRPRARRDRNAPDPHRRPQRHRPRRRPHRVRPADPDRLSEAAGRSEQHEGLRRDQEQRQPDSAGELLLQVADVSPAGVREGLLQARRAEQGDAIPFPRAPQEDIGGRRADRSQRRRHEQRRRGGLQVDRQEPPGRRPGDRHGRGQDEGRGHARDGPLLDGDGRRAPVGVEGEGQSRRGQRIQPGRASARRASSASSSSRRFAASTRCAARLARSCRHWSSRAQVAIAPSPGGMYVPS